MIPFRINVIPNDWPNLERQLNKLTRWVASQPLTDISSPEFAGLTIDTMDELLKATDGVVGEAAAGTDYEVPLTFSSSLLRTINDVALVADEVSPGNDYYYGTGPTGDKGFFTLSGFITEETDPVAMGYLDQVVKTTSTPEFVGLTLSATGEIDITNAVAAGITGLDVGIIQSVNPLTGTNKGIYSVVTNGEFTSSGTIRAIEGKARAATSGLVGGNVGTLEGMALSVDAKNKTVTLLRGAEIIMDAQNGASITNAVGLRISNNFQVNAATTSYGLHIYRDAFAYTADILLSNGGTISGSSYLNQDCRTIGSPTFANVTDSALTASKLVATDADKKLVSLVPTTVITDFQWAVTTLQYKTTNLITNTVSNWADVPTV